MIRFSLISTFSLWMALFFINTASADDISDARKSAVDILIKLEQGKNTEVWESNVSNWFKDRMTRDAFLANLTIIRAQLGGPGVDRKLVQQNQADGDPVSGYKGIVFSFTFSTMLPGAKVYEMIVLIREGNSYKLSGLNFLPNPN